jgi:2-phospho-L-lactate guanylyltransferase (CobY/MobA/RfbA family)
MNAVLIPVRSMTGAKNRLAADFDEDARTRLTLAMLADMVTAARSARTVDAVYVVSADAALLERARRMGARTLAETPHASTPDPGSRPFAKSSAPMTAPKCAAGSIARCFAPHARWPHAA